MTKYEEKKTPNNMNIPTGDPDIRVNRLRL